ncbi:hypothetical protein BD769DRAFT_1672367 [Suillus cothurnatus]|nr:hypothetical protein BD769DRAFT_1672367 [Suillus cothurnatus]
MPGYQPFKNLPAQAPQSITFPANPDSKSLTALLEDSQELPPDNEARSIHSSSDALKPILPTNGILELMSNDNLESLEDLIEEPFVPPPSLPVPPPTSYLPLNPLQSLLYPHPSYFPHTTQSPAEPCGQICVNNKIYTILTILFTSKGLIGCRTICYLVSLDEEEYIIQDHWVQGGEEKVLNETNMLKAMSSIPGVPELVDYWKIKRLDDLVKPQLDVCKLRKVYFFAVSSEEAHLEKQFHPYFAKLIPLAKEWWAILKDNMEAQVTFDIIISLLECPIATLEDDEEHSSTTENLKKSAAEITKHLKKQQAEGGSIEPDCIILPHVVASPKNKWAKHKGLNVFRSQPKKPQAAEPIKTSSIPLMSLHLDATSTDKPARRSDHVNAETRGRNTQLEKISALLEALSWIHQHKGFTSLDSTIPVNPQAPEPPHIKG